jgi:hypothetical protein
LEGIAFWRHSTLLNNKGVKFQLHGLFLNHFFLHGVFGDESINSDLLCLTNSMSSIHCLEIHLWIPVRVIQDNGISGHEIQTKPSCSSRYQENGLLCFFTSEVIDLNLSIIKLCVTIKSAVFIFSISTVIFHNVKHSCETGEYKSLRIISVSFPEQLIKHLHLSAHLDDVITKLWCVFGLNAME